MESSRDSDIAATCTTKGCEQLAVSRCERCGRLGCPAHMRSISIERRGERTEAAGHGGMLTRISGHIETYTFCLLCSKKPITMTPRHYGA
jgi:uncharacterized OB-fold protein